MTLTIREIHEMDLKPTIVELVHINGERIGYHKSHGVPTVGQALIVRGRERLIERVCWVPLPVRRGGKVALPNERLLIPQLIIGPGSRPRDGWREKALSIREIHEMDLAWTIVELVHPDGRHIGYRKSHGVPTEGQELIQSGFESPVERVCWVPLPAREGDKGTLPNEQPLIPQLILGAGFRARDRWKGKS